MAAEKAIRLSKIARELNVGISTIIDFLHKKGVEMNANPNTKVSSDVYDMLVQEYASEKQVKEESEKLDFGKARAKKETVSLDEEGEEEISEEDNEDVVDDVHEEIEKVEEEVFETEEKKEVKVKVVGKIELEKKEEEKEEVEEVVEEEVSEEPEAIEEPVRAV
jgi:translation initiation factor IF-2